jgi:hypothetical protein
MSAWQAVEGLIGVLSTGPARVLPAGHASLTRPAVVGDLPAVVVTADEVAEHAAGLGGLVRNRPPNGTASTATRCSGQLALELWAADQATMKTLADAIFHALAPTNEALAKAGFMRLTVRAIGPIEQVPLGGGTTATALRMTVGCTFAHETVAAEDPDGDHLIGTIHVEMQDGLHEVMELTPAVRDRLHPPKP